MLLLSLRNSFRSFARNCAASEPSNVSKILPRNFTSATLTDRLFQYGQRTNGGINQSTSSMKLKMNPAPLLSIAPSVIHSQERTVTKYSLNTGKRKTVHSVVERFYRLHWGVWIRRIAGSGKRLWKKRSSEKRKYQWHVFCNAKQSTMLDKMTTKYWKKRKFYVDDPYAPYHTRDEFLTTRKRPLPPS